MSVKIHFINTNTIGDPGCFLYARKSVERNRFLLKQIYKRIFYVYMFLLLAVTLVYII